MGNDLNLDTSVEPNGLYNTMLLESPENDCFVFYIVTIVLNMLLAAPTQFMKMIVRQIPTIR